MDRVEAGHGVTARGADRERLDGADRVARAWVGALIEPSGLAKHGRTPIEADGTQVCDERCRQARADHVQVPPGAGADVQQPEGVGLGCGGRQDVTDETHGGRDPRHERSDTWQTLRRSADQSDSCRLAEPLCQQPAATQESDLYYLQ